MENQPQGNYKQYSPHSIRNNEVGSGPAGRVLPRQVSTGSTRGTQTVGYGNTKIDGSRNVITVGDTIILDGGENVISVGNTIAIDGGENVITVSNDDGSKIGMGAIPGTDQFGFFATNSVGVVIMSIVSGALIMNDTTTDRVLLGKDEGGF